MRQTLSVLVWLFVAVTSVGAQEKTLMSSENAYGWFAGLAGRLTEIRSEFGAFAGVRGGLILDHKLIIGATAVGFTGDVEPDDRITDDDAEIDIGYGGIELTYVHNPDRIVHPVFGLLLGGGELRYTDLDGGILDPDEEDRDGFFVAEPVVGVEVNVHRNMRLNANVGYRFVSDVELIYVENGDLDGPWGGLTLKFGEF